ncbi:MAG: CBS domain-containing protein [Acidimicrobiia bacterium]|nr:CBS domain-containing protein [Acidimicrobiia bacterium]NNF69622.1 CBS domain-containing protein [Acidimicrobiia bacterium]
MRAVDIMSKGVVTVTPEETLKAAARLMIGEGVSGLPVVDGAGAVVGIITEADFLAKEASRGRTRYRRLLDTIFGEEEIVKAELVSEAMTPDPITIDPHARVSEAARIMDENKVKRLPVVDTAGKLLGIVSRADVVGAFIRPDEVIEAQLRQDVIRRILMIDDKELAVSVKDGIVMVGGTVPTKTDARLLEELAARLEGVIRVDADLSWRVDDTIAPG